MNMEAIRPLVRGDLDRVAHLVGINEMFPPEMMEDMTSPYLARETDSQRWIVFDDGEIRGVAYYVLEAMTEGTWNVLMIAVYPPAHGRGIGSALMRFIEDELARQGERILLVETSGLPEFKRTRGFYDMLGYDREARIREFYAVGDDKIVFRKALK